MMHMQHFFFVFLINELANSTALRGRKKNARMHRMHDIEFLNSVYYGT